jgi:hypothetical protein
LPITRFSTDGWGAYERHLVPAQPTLGKAHTQKIESKHINVRTRDQASRASHDVFLQNDHNARSGAGPLQPSQRIWGRHLMKNQQI